MVYFWTFFMRYLENLYPTMLLISQAVNKNEFFVMSIVISYNYCSVTIICYILYKIPELFGLILLKLDCELRNENYWSLSKDFEFEFYFRNLCFCAVEVSDIHSMCAFRHVAFVHQTQYQYKEVWLQNSQTDQSMQDSQTTCDRFLKIWKNQCCYSKRP